MHYLFNKKPEINSFWIWTQDRFQIFDKKWQIGEGGGVTMGFILIFQTGFAWRFFAAYILALKVRYKGLICY
jgi:hypothetical protein